VKNLDKSVTKTFRALEYLCRHDGQVGVTQLARQLDLNKSTTHRILATLLALGFVRRIENGAYTVSLKIGELGSLVSARNSLSQIAMPYLSELCLRTEETVLIAVLDGCHSLYLQKTETTTPGHIGATVGSRLPTYCCATGKVLLAFGQDLEPRIRAINFVRHTPHTITKIDELRRTLEKVRSDGFALNVEEFIVGVSGLALPIFNSGGNVAAALAITTLAHRLTATTVDRVVPLMRQTAASITFDLGYRNESEIPNTEDLKGTRRRAGRQT